MKRIIACLILVISICSCNINDDGPDYHFEIMPVESVDMPDNMVVDNTYEITMTYNRPNSCYVYSDVYYSYDDNTTRTVAVICSVYEGNNYSCNPLEYPEYEVTFNFKPLQEGTYTFKFWQGEDENGEDQYMVVDVPVTQ